MTAKKQTQNTSGDVYIGTSGWIYKDWAKAFYPAKTKSADLLRYYASQFQTVEINATFYRLPTESAVQGWHDQAPPGFLFAVKAPRAITHFKKLLPGAKSFPIFYDRIPLLRDHLGPVLWQLPGSFRKNVERLDQFLGSLPKWSRNAVEFRHESWWCDDVFEVLKKHGAALVSISTLSLPMDLTLTTDFTYIRFHGLEGGAAHDYTRRELKPWAEHLIECKKRGVSAYVYFNNDVNTRAPLNAKMLMQMVEKV
jgi:uncharacterized protein YecE (DUF72 family)